mmetsp:Transcript_149809/g.481189  ORF Transcript_149809/g.481189 Transcript_149809/m.481189 type:complete len:966 (+) Transcript_149809:125-3022(+)
MGVKFPALDRPTPRQRSPLSPLARLKRKCASRPGLGAEQAPSRGFSSDGTSIDEESDGNGSGSASQPEGDHTARRRSTKESVPRPSSGREGGRSSKRHLGRRHVAGPESCRRRGCTCSEVVPPWHAPLDVPAPRPAASSSGFRPRATRLRQRGGPNAMVLLQVIPQVPMAPRRMLRQPRVALVALPDAMLSKVLPPLRQLLHAQSGTSVDEASASKGDVVQRWLRTWDMICEPAPAEEVQQPAVARDILGDAKAEDAAVPFAFSAPSSARETRFAGRRPTILAAMCARVSQDPDETGGMCDRPSILASLGLRVAQEVGEEDEDEDDGDTFELSTTRRGGESAAAGLPAAGGLREDEGAGYEQASSDGASGSSPANPGATHSLASGHAQSTRKSYCMTLRSTVRDRLNRLQAGRAAKVLEQKASQEKDNLRKQFNELPAAEAEAIQKVFDRFDLDDSGGLDHDEVVEALKELGLSGGNLAEKREIHRICRVFGGTHRGDDEDGEGDDVVGEVCVDIFQFSLRVVPQVRNFLVMMQGNDLARYFYQYDAQGTGRLRAEQCLEIGRALKLDVKILRDVLDTRARSSKKDKGVKGIGIDEFHRVVVKCKEQVERAVRQCERKIKEDTQISDRVFNEFRQDIVGLHDLFSSLDEDNSGSLDSKEITQIMNEFGLMPRTAKERDEVQKILIEADVDGNGEFSFEEFLFLVKRIRNHHTNLATERAQISFRKYDKDGSGELSVQEICHLLEDLGAIPRSVKEQEELAALIHSVDEDGSGFIEFNEFQVLLQRIEERLKSSKFQEEVEHGLRSGYTESQLYDLRYVFDALDADGSAKLDINEVKHCLTMLGRKVSVDIFEATFKALDVDGSGELDFLEFMEFVKLLSTDFFDSSAAAFAQKVTFVEIKVLRRALERFGLTRAYVNTLTHQEAIDLVCHFFEIQPEDNLQEALQVKSVADFLDAAKAKSNQSKG